jgi:hypothetical protein
MSDALKAAKELLELMGLVLKMGRLRKELIAVGVEIYELTHKIEAVPALARELRKLQRCVPKTPGAGVKVA